MSSSPTILAQHGAIYDRLLDNWATTPVGLEWEDFDPAGAAHILPRIREQEARNVAYGATTKEQRQPGLLLIDVKTPLLDPDGNPLGNGTALGYAQTLKDLFSNVTISRVAFVSATARPLGPVGPWYVVQVSCPYWRDSTHTN